MIQISDFIFAILDLSLSCPRLKLERRIIIMLLIKKINIQQILVKHNSESSQGHCLRSKLLFFILPFNYFSFFFAKIPFNFSCKRSKVRLSTSLDKLFLYGKMQKLKLNTPPTSL